MKPFQAWKLLVVVAGFLLADAAMAQSLPHPVTLYGAPMQIIAVRGTQSDFLNTVTARNVSGKEISAFQIGVIMAAPKGCDSHIIPGKELRFPLERTAIPPGAQVQTQNYRLAPEDVAAFGKKHSVPAMNVLSQLAVIRVEFTDGTSWSLARSGPIYDRDLLSSDAAAQCSGRPGATPAQ
jgi:hypothetical protein